MTKTDVTIVLVSVSVFKVSSIGSSTCLTWERTVLLCFCWPPFGRYKNLR